MLARRWALSREEVRRGAGTRRRRERGAPVGELAGYGRGKATRLSRGPDLISPHLHPRLLSDVGMYRWTHHERISPRQLRVSSFRRPRSPPFLGRSREPGSKISRLWKMYGTSRTSSTRYHTVSSTLNDVRCIMLIDRNIPQMECRIFLHIAIEVYNIQSNSKFILNVFIIVSKNLSSF